MLQALSGTRPPTSALCCFHRIAEQIVATETILIYCKAQNIDNLAFIENVCRPVNPCIVQRGDEVRAGEEGKPRIVFLFYTE